MAKKIKYKKTRGRESFGDLSKVRWKLFIACLIIVFVVAGIGSAYTQIDSWYESVKPSITPPNWVFPVVWNILFFLIAISFYISWTNEKKSKIGLIFAFGINLSLNVLWSFLFFSMQNPTLAFYELIILWISIASMLFVTYKIKKIASYLLLPYFFWASFAAVLNYLIAFG